MPPFDDEGLFIHWTRGFMSNRTLYDDVQAIFGPAYFLYQWLGCLLTGAQPTTDSVRLISAFFWVAVAFLAFVAIRRATRSWVVALVSQLLVFQLASFIGAEPAHPQELCLLAVVAVAAISSADWPKRVQLALYGAITGVLICAKINAGVLLAIVVTVASVYALRPGVFSRAAKVACSAGALAFVPLLLFPNLTMPWAQRLLILELCSISALLIAMWPPRAGVQLKWSGLAAIAGAFGATAVGILLFAIVRGSSVHAMIEWMIIEPRKVHGSQWYLPLEIPVWYTLWAFCGMLLAVAVRAGYVTPRHIAILKTVLGVSVMAMAAAHRYGALICLPPPFIWLITIPSREDEERLDVFGRNLMAMTAVVFVLYAYPVAGAQIRFANTVLVLVSAIILGDALHYWAGVLPAPGVSLINKAVCPAAIGLILVADILMLTQARTLYLTLLPLNLPGAARLRLPAEQVRSLQEITSRVKESCSLLFTVPGMPSFNLWAGMAPPPATLVAYSIGSDDASQRELIKDIAAAPRPCVIYNSPMLTLWTQHADVSGKPIILFVKNDFHDILVSQDAHLKIRN